MTVTDDDTRGVTFTPTDLTVDEGSTGTYTVKLDTEPTATVTVTIVDPTDNADVAANPASLTFSTYGLGHGADGNGFGGRGRRPLAGHGHRDAHRGRRGLRHHNRARRRRHRHGQRHARRNGLAHVADGRRGQQHDTYTVELNTQPSGDVTVAISSDNTDVTASPSSTDVHNDRPGRLHRRSRSRRAMT